MLARPHVVTLGLVLVSGLLFSGPAAAQTCPPLLNHTFARLQDESPQPLCQYQGRVLLVVNTASYCGYTPQYEGLEKLHAHHAARGLIVLAFLREILAIRKRPTTRKSRTSALTPTA
jgi:glutathione peroxidase